MTQDQEDLLRQAATRLRIVKALEQTYLLPNGSGRLTECDGQEALTPRLENVAEAVGSILHFMVTTGAITPHMACRWAGTGAIPDPISVFEKPLAANGLTSYRCPSQYPGEWIMIGAKDHNDAMSEALRSYPKAKRELLQVWDGYRYVGC